MKESRLGSPISQRNSRLLAIFSVLLACSISSAAIGQSRTDDFRSSCAAHYAKRQPDDSALTASRWCVCMDSALNNEAKIDFLNSLWFATIDPSNQQDRDRAARILNLRPEDLQDQPTPAANAAIQSFISRVQTQTSSAKAQCLTDLKYKKKQ